ncbi:NAD(P)-dependent oxidoreductase [Alphaproteobacteria bacterium]|nr:NAD(P)-dependent oxidoreductase [Alphaproteobacteria bacterium]
MKDTNVGFIGLGNVGSRIAENVLRGGFKLFINDLNRNLSKNLIEKGAKWSSNLESLASQSTIIITCLPSPSAVDTVMSNLLPFLNTNHLWIEMSTTDESEMIRLSNLCLQKGAESLEAPITGGQHKAENGNISILAAGKRKNFERVFPLLSEIGYEILYCGKLGNASTLKVVTNYLASINLLSLGEALMVCKKYGLDLTTAYHGIRISSGNSYVHETESKVILNGSYDVGFTMDLVCKDVGLFDKLTDKFNIPAEISKLMNKIFKEGLNKYGKRSLSTGIVRILEDRCNENLRALDFPSQLVDNEPRKKGIEIKV